MAEDRMFQPVGGGVKALTITNTPHCTIPHISDNGLVSLFEVTQELT